MEAISVLCPAVSLEAEIIVAASQEEISGSFLLK